MKNISKLLTLAIVAGAANLSAEYCPRCAHIEAERAKEQAAHPQTVGYYDDQVNVQKDNQLAGVGTDAKMEDNKLDSSQKNQKASGESKGDEAIAELDNSDFARRKLDASAQMERSIQSDNLQNPGMQHEQEATQKAKQRYSELTDQNRSMVEKDRSMMNESYDPNQGYGGFPKPGLNSQAPNQESKIRGEDATDSATQYSPQGWR